VKQEQWLIHVITDISNEIRGTDKAALTVRKSISSNRNEVWSKASKASKASKVSANQHTLHYVFQLIQILARHMILLPLDVAFFPTKYTFPTNPLTV
jgi:hypothetical protein